MSTEKQIQDALAPAAKPPKAKDAPARKPSEEDFEAAGDGDAGGGGADKSEPDEDNTLMAPPVADAAATGDEQPGEPGEGGAGEDDAKAKAQDKADPLSPRFAALSKLQKSVNTAKAALKAERALAAKEFEEVKAARSELAALGDLIRKDAVAAIEKMGQDPEQVYEALTLRYMGRKPEGAAAPKPVDPAEIEKRALAAVEARLKTEREAAEKQRLETEAATAAARLEAEKAKAHHHIKVLAGKGEHKAIAAYVAAKVYDLDEVAATALHVIEQDYSAKVAAVRAQADEDVWDDETTAKAMSEIKVLAYGDALGRIEKGLRAQRNQHAAVTLEDDASTGEIKSRENTSDEDDTSSPQAATAKGPPGERPRKPTLSNRGASDGASAKRTPLDQDEIRRRVLRELR